MITYDGYKKEEPPANPFFVNHDANSFYGWRDWSAEEGLERLVFQVARKPKALESHLERIYYCFQNDLKEQLYGALTDLLIVLNHKGLALARRMVSGAKTKLTELQLQVLSGFFEDNQINTNSLTGNRYSIFSKGVQTTARLLAINDDESEKTHDPLMIARDFIEFSQLEEATHILEAAVMANWERTALHQELLALYWSTRNVAGFNRMRHALAAKNAVLPPEWGQLNDFFLRMPGNGN